MRRGDDDRRLDGPALHPVAGQRVGVLDVLRDVAGRQLADEAAVGFDHDPIGVDVADGAARAVVDVERPVVAAADHPVADRDLDRAVGALLAERARFRAAARVRRWLRAFAGVVVAGDHHCPARARHPRRFRAHSATACSHAPAGSLNVSIRPACPAHSSHRAGWPSCSAPSARRSCGSRWRITSVKRCAPTARPTARSHPPACTEASCPGSPIATTFAPALSRRLQEPRSGPGRRHARLVKDQNATAAAAPRRLLEVEQQPVQRPRRDPSLLGKLARPRGPSARRRAPCTPRARRPARSTPAV